MSLSLMRIGRCRTGAREGRVMLCRCELVHDRSHFLVSQLAPVSTSQLLTGNMRRACNTVNMIEIEITRLCHAIGCYLSFAYLLILLSACDKMYGLITTRVILYACVDQTETSDRPLIETILVRRLFISWILNHIAADG